MRRRWIGYLCAALLPWTGAAVQAAGRLEISHAWIRAAPPGASMLAGYALLRNSGDSAVTIVAADSADFAGVSLHESVTEKGLEHMRPLGRLSIAPGASVAFAPGGRHFMLMNPAHELAAGASATIRLTTASGAQATASFEVRDAAP